MPPSPKRQPAARLSALLAAALTLPLILTAPPALAQGRGWDGRWNEPGGAGPWGANRWDSARSLPGDDTREGRVTVERFPGPDSAALLGHGIITLSTPPSPDAPAASAPPGQIAPPTAPLPGAPPIAPLPTPSISSAHPYGQDYVSPREAAIFEAAVIDRLAKAGYNTAAPPTAGGQVAQLHISHSLLVPREERRSPVSGEVAMGASNHGSMLGLGLNIDLSKPRAALISTTLALRIRDAASGRPLWEGRASIATREGSSRWSDEAIATRLAAALFEGFAPAPRLTPQSDRISGH